MIELHPSATVFNHVIAQVNLDGQIYWLDATANYERGPLAVRSWPCYGWALVVGPGTTELTAVAPSPELPRTTVTEYIHLGQVDQDSTFKVVTIAEGRDAEWLRKLFTITARTEIERANLSYYSGYYTDIAQTKPLVYADNEQQNEIEVDEFYTVSKNLEPDAKRDLLPLPDLCRECSKGDEAPGRLRANDATGRSVSRSSNFPR